MSNRHGDWFLSFTGKKIYPFDMRSEDVCIEDIAHSLSHLCRFNGHTREFYSVAQHSVLMTEQLQIEGYDRETLFAALMHDTTEAYCGDMVRPIKLMIPTYKDMENRIWYAIADRFGLPNSLPGAVKIADSRILMTERRDLLTVSSDVWREFDHVAPYWAKICPWSPQQAKAAFMSYFKALYL